MSETPGITAPKFTLPIAKTPATLTNPRVLVIFAKPKIGKTSLMAELEDNLILDLEKGTGYINALKIEIDNFKDIGTIINTVKEQGCPYKYITVDTVTALEEMIIPFAEQLYMNTPKQHGLHNRNIMFKILLIAGKPYFC